MAGLPLAATSDAPPHWPTAQFYGIAKPSLRILHFASIAVAKTKGVWYKLVTTDGLEEDRWRRKDRSRPVEALVVAGIVPL